MQEALLAAALQWPAEGVRANPRGWLITVASRRLIDQWRSDEARLMREVTVASEMPPRYRLPITRTPKAAMTPSPCSSCAVIRR